MKEIFNIKLKYTGLFLLLGVLLTSCGDEESYDFPGTNINKVYLQSFSNTVNGYDKYTGIIVHTPKKTITDIDFKLPVRSTIKTANKVSVTLAVDNSLVDAYNFKHNTKFQKIPDGLVSLENATVVIPPNSQLSSDSVRVFINNDKAASLVKGSYLIPVKISSLEGDDSQISENRNTIYVEVQMSEDVDNIWDGMNASGTIIKDRSKWTVTVAPEPASQFGDPISIFDGIDNSYNNYWYIKYKEQTSFVVDMKTIQQNIIGLYINRFVSKSKIFSSNDGNSWEEIGTTSYGSIALYAPINARYIKWEIPASTSSFGSTLYFFEFEVRIK